MYISNITQSKHRNGTLPLINSHLLSHRVTSCAKAISALLLALSSTASWANYESWHEYEYDDTDTLRIQVYPLGSPRPKVVPYHPDNLYTYYNIAPAPREPINQMPSFDSYVKKGTKGWKARRNEWQQNENEWKEKHDKWEEEHDKWLKDINFKKAAMEKWVEFEEETKKSDQQRLIEKQEKQQIEENKKTFVNMLKKLSSEQPAEATTTEDGLLAEVQAGLSEFSKLAQAVSSTIEDIIPSETTETAAKTKVNAPKKAPVKPVEPVVPKTAPIIGHNPQVGSYIANQIAAQQMFITDDLQYRLGETRYIDPVTGEEKVSSLWLNTSGAKNRFNSGNDQLRTKSNRYAIQLGGTLNKWSSGGDDQGILGITAGLGKSTNHSHSTSSHHQAQGSVDGYNLGLYSIWYADNQTRLGPYIDLLTQYGWFNNQVKAPNVTTAAHYKSYLFTSALETGYKIQLIETADSKLSLQPRAKVMWQRTSGLLHKEPNAIIINVEEDNAVTTKLGMRTVLEFDIDTLSSAKNLQISPSFEANWIHSRVKQGVQLSRAYANPQRLQDKLELASVNVSPQGNNNLADLKLGIEANIDSNLRLWTYLGHQFGGHNYSDTQATVGMNYRF